MAKRRLLFTISPSLGISFALVVVSRWSLFFVLGLLAEGAGKACLHSCNTKVLQINAVQGGGSRYSATLW